MNCHPVVFLTQQNLWLNAVALIIKAMIRSDLPVDFAQNLAEECFRHLSL